MRIKQEMRIGYKIVADIGNKTYGVSLYGGRQFKISLHVGKTVKYENGLYLGTTEKFVKDYYTGLSDYRDILLTYEYDDADVKSGDPNSPDGEVAVFKATLKKVDRLEEGRMSKAQAFIKLTERKIVYRIGDFIVQRLSDSTTYGYITKILKNGAPYGVSFTDYGPRHGGKAAFTSFGNANPPFEPIADAEIPEKILKKLLAKVREKPQGGSPWHNEGNTIEEDSTQNKWTEGNYRILVKNDQGKFMPIEGISNGKPVFVTNVIHGLVLWNIDLGVAKKKFNDIRSKYPDLEFKFVEV